MTNMWPDRERPWYGSFVQSQAKSLREIGLEVAVMGIRGYASKWQYARAAHEIVKRNFADEYDVVHAHYGHSAFVARLQVRRPLVISYCGDDLLGTPSPKHPSRMTRRSRALATAFAQAGRLASATITKSRQMALQLPRSVKQRNYVIPNGVDLEMFKRIDQAEARRQLGWEHQEKVMLFVGNPAIPRKNYALAERACQLAARRCSDLRLRLAHGVPPQEIPIWMSAADVLIHPSWSEGSPNAVKEAMACELPVVATPVGDVPERLDGIVGCHVVAADEEAFAEATLDALAHHPCAPARAAVEELTLERVAKRVSAVYEAVTAHRR